MSAYPACLGDAVKPQIYSPGAGHVPPGDRLPGRSRVEGAWSDMVGDVAQRGRAGARDLVLTGNRGVGKTVLMKRLSALAEAQGYVRLPFQASSQVNMGAALQQAMAGHRERTPAWRTALDGLQRVTGVSVGLAGVSASLSREVETPGPQADPFNTAAIAAAITDLALVVAESDRGGVLLCIDELQMSSAPDMETLGGVLNHLNNWHPQARVLFVAAGLPNTMSRMMGADPEHPLISNPSRLFFFETLDQYLTLEETSEALRPAARDHGADWTPEAVVEVHRVTQGYPAHVQVLAAAAWTAADGPVVDVQDVRAAVPIAEAEVARMYLLPRWDRMSDLKRAYVTAASMCDSPTEVGRIAAMLGRTTTGVSKTRDELVRAGDIYSTAQGYVSLAQPLMRGFAPRHYYDTVEGTEGVPTLREMSTARDTWTDRRRKPREPLSRAEIEALSSPSSVLGRDRVDRDLPGQQPPAGPEVQR